MRDPSGQSRHCFHCGQPVPAGVDACAVVDGEARAMCCHGCRLAAETIVACGLDRFYRVRTAQGPRPDAAPPGAGASFAAFDDPELQQGFVTRTEAGRCTADLLLDGISCAACSWLIEQRVAALPGVALIVVNYAARTARVEWDTDRIRLGAILEAVAGLGYHAAPYDAAAADRQLARERNLHLRRIGIAGLFGMQIMMLSLGLYLGADAGTDAGIAPLLRWSAAVLVLPILLYSAVPFFRGAQRNLATGTLGMDVPVALGIAIAFLGSLHALATGRGHVYFDSIAMFVFILLCGRFVEFSIRRRTAAQWDRLQRIQPALAVRMRGAGDAEFTEIVPVTALAVGDLVQVRPGDTVPADGVIERGESSMDESLLTGESHPLRRGAGAVVPGGSINRESPLWVRVQRVSGESRLARIARLARDAAREKPALETYASQVAARFIARLLVIACGVAAFWGWYDASRWIPVTVSVLVITCPCALALAAPAALAAATGTLLRLGLLVRRPDAVETLGRATRFVFDKTGTLTRGELRVEQVRVAPGVDAHGALALAAALEAGSEHPVGRAIRAAQGQTPPAAASLRAEPGAGIAGIIEGRRHFIGSAAYISRMIGAEVLTGGAGLRADAQAATEVVLAEPGRVLAVILLRDSLRPGARELVASLRDSGSSVGLLSGDSAAAVAAVARELDIDGAEGALLPEHKVARLQQWRAAGTLTCMTGDGVNDAPVLAAANVSVAMGTGADLARASADIVLLDGRLDHLRHGIAVARRTRVIMRQNVAWAIGYNVIAVPLAASGAVTPWMAALGMSLSSLAVVLNAARLGRGPVREA